MDRKPKKMVTVAEIWMSLTADSRQSVCDTLATYSGPDVDPWFSGLVKLAHRKQVATGSTTQMETDGKRKRDDGSDVAQPRSKKPRPAESTASSEPGDTDGVWSPSGSLLYALAEPTSSVSATASSSVAPLSPETRSNTVRENSSNTPVKPASSTANSAFNFGQSAPIKRETSVEQPSDCDEQLTCADRAPRKLKCIQCKEFYMEDQNTAMECRRHPGRCVDVNDKKFYYHDTPAGASRVWDCCRRTVCSLGCKICNHYAG